jgi:hypothetical protein
MYYKQNVTPFFDTVIPKMISQLQKSWEERLQIWWGRLREEEQKNFIDQLAPCGDESRRSTWSSTLLVGVIWHKEQRIDVANAGDSEGFIATDRNETERVLPNRKRIFVSIEWYPHIGMPQVKVVAQDFVRRTCDNVVQFGFLTDGNIPSNRWLEEFLSASNENASEDEDYPLENLYRTLRRLRGKTYDDKAILFGTRFYLEDTSFVSVPVQT